MVACECFKYSAAKDIPIVPAPISVTGIAVFVGAMSLAAVDNGKSVSYCTL